MTKKDYELIAGELRDLKRFVDRTNDLTDGYSSGKYDTWYVAVCSFCATLKNKNSKFDRSKFLNSCGIIASNENNQL